MHKLTTPMWEIIRNFNAGAVATVNDDGSPAVSPKATFVIVDEGCIAYGDIRSPGTSANLASRPAIEVNFIDILTRTAVRVSGTAQVVTKDSSVGQQLVPYFEEYWSAYLQAMQHFVCISIHSAELITSPAYDVGLKREELVKTNFEKISSLIQN
ncbi:MAG: pyridoxamine 5'-phosphate oxidase family protein [Gammaproteobacteria bacterium]|nr:pyridoxamine 5'-phosphate oxidase family protein [Gammaproteobacteria bacterium]